MQSDSWRTHVYLQEEDAFKGEHSGLVLAECELESADAELALPDWIGQEVTDDPAYRNSSLV